MMQINVAFCNRPLYDNPLGKGSSKFRSNNRP